MPLTPHTRIKIAIADDHAIFKQGIETVLQLSPDMDVIFKADNGADLLDLLKVNQPDVILLDLQMPVMDGFSTLPELKKHYPNIMVIILTLNAETSEVVKALQMGANGYLLKTSDPTTIANKIRECLQVLRGIA
jgi:DNA-binding NarL/FixJ family response regulator